MNFLRSNVEKDTESFVKTLVKLTPLEVSGVAKLLKVRTTRDPKEIGVSLDDYTTKTDEEKEELKNMLIIPAEEILVSMIDAFAALPKKRRREILKLIKTAAGG